MASPRFLSELQNLRPHPRSTEPEPACEEDSPTICMCIKLWEQCTQISHQHFMSIKLAFQHIQHFPPCPDSNSFSWNFYPNTWLHKSTQLIKPVISETSSLYTSNHWIRFNLQFKPSSNACFLSLSQHSSNPSFHHLLN